MRVSEGSVLKRRHIVPLEKMVSSIAIANGVQSRSGWREKWEEHAALQLDTEPKAEAKQTGLYKALT